MAVLVAALVCQGNTYLLYDTSIQSTLRIDRVGDGLPPRGPMTTPGSRALGLRATAATYPGRAEQVAAVRADLRLLLAGCPIADDVIHCASELAANAVRHSQSRLAGGTFIVRTEIYPGDYIWIEVEDD